jgi:hypothetical protein
MATNKTFNAEQGLSVGTGATLVIDASRNVSAATIGTGAVTVTAAGITQSGGNNSFTGQSSFISSDTKQILVKNDLTYIKSASGTSGQNTIVVANNTSLTLGMLAVGTGVAANATITNIAGTTITLSLNNSGTVSGNITFSSPALYIGSSAEYPFILTGGGTGSVPIWTMGYDGKLGLGGTPSAGELLLVNGTMRVVNNLTVDGTLITSASLNIVANTTLGTNSGNTLTVNATPTFQTAGTLNGTTWSAGGWSNLGAVTTVDINGGTIDGTAIGVTTTSSGRFTSVNKLVITEPAGSSTLTILNGKTLTVNNSLTFSGDDATAFNIGTEIGNAIDLNTFTTSGLYYQTSDAEAAAGTNYPTPSAGVLEVLKGSNAMIWQRYTVYKNGGVAENDVYLRSYYTSTWSAWVRQANAADKLNLFASTTSAELAGVISDKTGSGALVFATSPTLTTPRFVNDGFIADSNGNELLQFGVNASAVNQIKIDNAITAAGPIVRAVGETNVPLNLYSAGSGDVTLGSSSTALTNSVYVAAKVMHNTSGTPANGIGVGFGFQVETAASNWEIGATINAVTTDVTALSEDFDLVFNTMAAGAAAAERMKLNNTGLSIPTSHTYQINGTNVLTSTALGSGVTGSSLTSVGTLTGLTVTGTVTVNSANPLTISSGVGSAEGGHLVLSYKNVAVVGQSNSTWNIDVDPNNALRLFRQSAAGATLMCLDIAESTGLVTMSNGFQANAASSVVGASFSVTRSDASDVALIISGNAGQSRYVEMRTGASKRVLLVLSSTAEGGSNAGSDFQINTYTDAGAYLATPFTVTRSTGNVLLTSDLTVSGGDITCGNVASNLFAGNTTTNSTICSGLTSGSLTIGSLTATGYINLQATTGMRVPKGTTAQQPVAATAGVATIRYNTDTNQFEGVSGASPTWLPLGGATISDDTTTNATYYPTFVTTTSGVATSVKVSSSKLTYNPSTGILTAGGGVNITDATTITGTAPKLTFIDTDGATTGGARRRIVVDGNVLTIRRNTAAGGDFSTEVTDVTVGATGELSALLLNVSGASGAFSINTRNTGTNWINYNDSGILRWYKTAATAGDRLTLNDAGDLTATGNVYANSDITLKTDIVRIEAALDKVSQLGGYTFTRIDTGVRQTGVIAQEVNVVLPEAVGQNSDGTLSVSYGHMAGLIIEAIKELREQVEELKRKVG